MIHLVTTARDKLRYVFAGTLVLAGLFLLSLLLTSLLPSQSAAATSSSTVTANMSGEPNAVTAGMAAMSEEISATLGSAGTTIANGTRTASQTTASAFIGSGAFAARSARSCAIFTGRAAAGSILLAARGTGNVAALLARSTGSIFGFIGNAPGVRAAIRPASAADVPVINEDTTAMVAAHSALPAAQAVSLPVQTPAPGPDQTPQWPIHGQITTLFGVPEPPFQPIHTGIDISDGRWSGVTPVHPYRPGKIIAVVHSGLGLGNHIIIDHGNDITSVYGHLYSTAVAVGQDVDKSTVLGIEGSTGASTGPHVHFEIRLNGQPINPALYISGQP